MLVRERAELRKFVLEAGFGMHVSWLRVAPTEGPSTNQTPAKAAKARTKAGCSAVHLPPKQVFLLFEQKLRVFWNWQEGCLSAPITIVLRDQWPVKTALLPWTQSKFQERLAGSWCLSGGDLKPRGSLRRYKSIVLTCRVDGSAANRIPGHL